MTHRDRGVWRARYAIAMACLLAVASLLTSACFDSETLIFAPTQTSTQTQGGGTQPSPGAAASPGAAGACFVHTVRTGPFGFDCNLGVTAPSNNSGVLPMGCRANITATPKDINGDNIAPAQHGPIGTWRVTSGNVSVIPRPDDSLGFNAIVTPLGPGPFTVANEVCGKPAVYQAVVQ